MVAKIQPGKKLTFTPLGDIAIAENIIPETAPEAPTAE